jgi:hypothetical protein
MFTGKSPLGVFSDDEDGILESIVLGGDDSEEEEAKKLQRKKRRRRRRIVVLTDDAAGFAVIVFDDIVPGDVGQALVDTSVMSDNCNNRRRGNREFFNACRRGVFR